MPSVVFSRHPVERSGEEERGAERSEGERERRGEEMAWIEK